MADLFTLRAFGRNLLREEIAEEIFFLYFVLMPDLGYEPWALRLISQHTNY